MNTRNLFARLIIASRMRVKYKMINKEKSIDMSKFCKTDFPLRGGTLLPLLIQ